MQRTRVFPHARERALASIGAVALLLLSGWPAWSAAAEQGGTQRQPPSSVRYADLIAEAAERFEIPATWIRAVLHAESDGDARSTSPKGAMGLMQIMPQTWAELRVRYGLGDDPYDLHDNITAGAAYLRELFDRYGAPGFLAAYNAGPARYEASRKGRALPTETRAYVDALAPVVEQDGAGGIASHVSAGSLPEPPSWARAPLFILPPVRTSMADPAPSERVPSEAQATAPVRDVSAIVPQSAGLFIARAGTGASQ
ncbi:MAG: lytic transglycosylase domain-containing protein [Pseudomonadota bacterium]